MSSVDNTVTLTIQSYNQMKNQSIRCDLLFENLFRKATLTLDNQLKFNSDDIRDILLTLYYDKYMSEVDKKIKAEEELNSENKSSVTDERT